ncbi:MAG TPA: alpha/beta family hydrolase [Acidimicrobiales bacterium]|nr:alpha/beta family hydrolase [Acidimicrobiales bacterium]
MIFQDRADAGRQVAERLGHLCGNDVVVLGLPRGGVPVAFEVAKALGAPLDVIVVRKLGVPFQPELAMGAIGEDGVRITNEVVVRGAGIGPEAFGEVEQRERAELERRVRLLRRGRARVSLEGRTAVVVDDGIATGSTARAACLVARAHGAAAVVLAAPVGAQRSITELEAVADEVVCVETPVSFFAIGEWYDDFRPTTDEEVVRLLERSLTGATDQDDEPRAVADQPRPAVDEDVRLPVEGAELSGHLVVPDGCSAVVVFVHGSGSSRHSPRNRYVAAELQQRGLGTLLFDLLTTEEELNRANVFDICLLASRLVEVTAWLEKHPATAGARLGYFGASTGAGAALYAAPETDVAAVVSRGGRPDLAAEHLALVRAPTLLLVGGRDEAVLELNRRAAEQLRCEHRIEVVPGATHLFEEPGALAQVAQRAGDWFVRYMPPEPAP